MGLPASMLMKIRIRDCSSVESNVEENRREIEAGQEEPEMPNKREVREKREERRSGIKDTTEREQNNLGADAENLPYSSEKGEVGHPLVVIEDKRGFTGTDWHQEEEVNQDEREKNRVRL